MSWFDWVCDSIKDRRFPAILAGVFVVVVLIRLPSPPLGLPEAAHNTVGDMPLFEQADDGYVSSVGEEGDFVISKGNYENTTCSYFRFSSSAVSTDTIFYS